MDFHFTIHLLHFGNFLFQVFDFFVFQIRMPILEVLLFFLKDFNKSPVFIYHLLFPREKLIVQRKSFKVCPTTFRFHSSILFVLVFLRPKLLAAGVSLTSANPWQVSLKYPAPLGALSKYRVIFTKFFKDRYHTIVNGLHGPH